MAADLSNSELFEKLRSFGVDVGPVNDTTREVYLKKYRAVLVGGPTPPRAQQPRPSPSPSSSKKQHPNPPFNQETSRKAVSGPATPPTTPPGLAADHPESERVLGR